MTGRDSHLRRSYQQNAGTIAQTAAWRHCLISYARKKHSNKKRESANCGQSCLEAMFEAFTDEERIIAPSNQSGRSKITVTTTKQIGVLFLTPLNTAPIMLVSALVGIVV